MTVQTKICGLSTPETLDAAITHGASHVGFVFFPPSPRDLSIDRANDLSGQIPDHVKTVAVLVDPADDMLAQLLSAVRIDILQLHGNETPQRAAYLKEMSRKEIWKAIPVRTAHDVAKAHFFGLEVSRVVYDSKPPSVSLPGGSGLRFDWKLIQGHQHQRQWALSGGLDAANIAEAVRVTGARMVDVSSGVESAPGRKDVDKIAAFLQAVARL